MSATALYVVWQTALFGKYKHIFIWYFASWLTGQHSALTVYPQLQGVLYL